MAALKNARHERFVQNLIKGMSQRQAYLDAYPSSRKWKSATVDVKASNLFANDKILVRYQEIQEQQKQDALLTRWEKRKILADIARSKDEDSDCRIRAVDTDNKMEGEYISKIDMAADTEVKIVIDYGEDDSG